MKFKTIGIVTAMQALPLTGYGAKYINSCMTLSKLKSYLQKSLEEDTKNIEKVRKELGKSCIFQVKSKKTVTEDGSTLNGLYSEEAKKAGLNEKFSGITNVQFNKNDEPIYIETLNVFSLSYKYNFENQNFLLWIGKKRWIEKERRFENTEKRLEAFSKPLSGDQSAEVEEAKKYSISSVSEITFASILDSGFFTDEQRKKAKEWLDDNNKLNKAIDNYAANYPYIQKKVVCEHKNTRIDVVSSQTPDSFIVTEGIPEDPNFIELSYLILKKAGEASKTEERIKTLLKGMLPFQNGKEKVILLLLLDEATPKEDRLKWIHEKDCFGFYDAFSNAIVFDSNKSTKFLSHEIGHYLQIHLGLCQTFDDYQTPFARELLQLENNQTEDLISIPKYFRENMEDRSDPFSSQQANNPFKCPEQLSAKKFFEYFQLMIRWRSAFEISNILGVYFKNNTLYLNALSDIRELKRVRYTHNAKIQPNDDSSFRYKGGEKNQSLFLSVVKEAFSKPVPTKVLGLLCRLHGRKDAEDVKIFCDFDYDCNEEYYQKMLPLVSELLKTKP